jgi:glutathione S-transferase
MHSGFASLRASLPMNMRRKVKKRELSPETAADIERLESAFSSAREEFGQPGGFLFGDFSAADAMFAPVVKRLDVYDVDVSAQNDGAACLAGLGCTSSSGTLGYRQI